MQEMVWRGSMSDNQRQKHGLTVDGIPFPDTPIVIVPNKTVVCPAILSRTFPPNRTSKTSSKNNKNAAKQGKTCF